MKLVIFAFVLALLAGCASAPTSSPDGRASGSDPVRDCAGVAASNPVTTVHSTKALFTGTSSFTTTADASDVLVFVAPEISYMNLTITSDSKTVRGSLQWAPGVFDAGNGFERDLVKYEHYIPAGCHTLLVKSGSNSRPYTVTLNVKPLQVLAAGTNGPFTVKQAWTDLGVIHVAAAGHLNVTTSKTPFVDAGLYVEKLVKDHWYQSAKTIQADLEPGDYVLRFSVGSIDYHKFPATFTVNLATS